MTARPTTSRRRSSAALAVVVVAGDRNQGRPRRHVAAPTEPFHGLLPRIFISQRPDARQQGVGDHRSRVRRPAGGAVRRDRHDRLALCSAVYPCETGSADGRRQSDRRQAGGPAREELGRRGRHQAADSAQE